MSPAYRDVGRIDADDSPNCRSMYRIIEPDQQFGRFQRLKALLFKTWYRHKDLDRFANKERRRFCWNDITFEECSSDVFRKVDRLWPVAARLEPCSYVFARNGAATI